ncbi:MAG: hypothetical protein FWB78_00345 [Treponema sp.]|nr:hypothetical protein [Treponema sp.]
MGLPVLLECLVEGAVELVDTEAGVALVVTMEVTEIKVPMMYLMRVPLSGN